MEKSKVIKMLSDLIQMDVDAAGVYEKAIQGAEDRLVRERLAKFQETHRRHIENLAQAVEDLGGEPPDASPDIKGIFREALAAIRAAGSGTEGSLKALKATEEETSRRYLETISLDLPPEVKDMLRKHSSDERIHLDYVETNLKAFS